MKLPNKVYDVLKFIITIVSPAFITLLTTLTELWGWNIPINAINGTIAAVTTFIGICLGISTYQYRKAVN